MCQLTSRRALALHYGKVVRQTPFDYTARYLLGEALFHQDRTVPALYHVLIAYFGRDPRTKRVLPRHDSLVRRRAQRAYLLGQIYENLANDKEAHYFYRQTLALEAVHEGARRRLARLVGN